jgi:hypothetical protein
MFCPGCTVPVTDDTKFCKSCGANLRGVREAMQGRGGQFDWSKTWVAEMFMTEEERERRRGVTPEQKRMNEIKAGVITTLAGLGAMIFLRFFLAAVADANPEGEGAEIIRRVWLAGVVPFLVGIGLLFNGIFLSKHSVKQAAPPALVPLPSPTTNQLGEAPRTHASVVEHTTAHLPERREAVYAPLREDPH